MSDSDTEAMNKVEKMVVGVTKTTAHALAAAAFMAVRIISEPEGRRGTEARAELAAEEADYLFDELGLLPEYRRAVRQGEPTQGP